VLASVYFSFAEVHEHRIAAERIEDGEKQQHKTSFGTDLFLV
jgi:hypothetical protein